MRAPGPAPFPFPKLARRSATCTGWSGPGPIPLPNATPHKPPLRPPPNRRRSGEPRSGKPLNGFIAANKAGWRNAKHRAQWGSTLATYAYPHMGDLPLADVETEHVLAALQPIWITKPETAARVRGRIEAVLDYAKATGLRTGDNPARWRGHLSNTLPARGKVAPVQHHAALPWQDVGTFMAALQRQPGMGARALEFTILTAARSGEALGARWSEIDMDAALWTISGGRMKAKREHRVPLTPSALAVLADVARLRLTDGPDAFVFPARRPAGGCPTCR